MPDINCIVITSMDKKTGKMDSKFDELEKKIEEGL